MHPRQRLTQLEHQLDQKPKRPKSKKAKAARQELMREVHELRGVVRDVEIGEGTRPKPSGARRRVR